MKISKMFKNCKVFIKNLYIKIANIINRYRLKEVVSSLTPLALSIINFISLFIDFDYGQLYIAIFFLLYSITLFLFNFTSLVNKFINPYILGLIMLISFALPMIASLGYMLFRKAGYKLLFDWLSYGYVLYAFIKLGLSIYKLNKHKKINNPKDMTLGLLGLISSLFTLSVLENYLLELTSSKNDYSMFVVSVLTQFSVFICAIIIIFILLYKYLISRRNKESSMGNDS